MYKNHINLDFVTDEMLSSIKFTEHNHVALGGGIWDALGVAMPNFPYESPWVHQSFEENCPQWAHDIKNLFKDDLMLPTVTLNLVEPGRFIPPHRDLFYRLLQHSPKNILDKEPVRINIFLQDWQIGHIFEMEGETWMNYKKGDFTIIRKGVLHSVINIGYAPRYTMQISGFAEKGRFT